MTTTIQTRLSFDLCFNDPDGDRLSAFEVNFHWRVPAYDNRERFELLLQAHDWMQMDDLCAGLKTRYSHGSKGTRLHLGSGRRRRVFKIAATGSGGNMYWETVVPTIAAAPHLINFLRRQKNFAPTEWDDTFRGRVWLSRRSVDRCLLRGFGGEFVHEWLHRQADGMGLSVERLLGGRHEQG
jgi:hypothetical protein